MKKFVCMDCGYRFDSERIKPKCPYCGQDNIDKDKSAEELVKDF